jgi:hypothetical protein
VAAGFALALGLTVAWLVTLLVRRRVAIAQQAVDERAGGLLTDPYDRGERRRSEPSPTESEPDAR